MLLFIPAYAVFLWVALRLGRNHLIRLVDHDDQRIQKLASRFRLRTEHIADPELHKERFKEVYRERASAATCGVAFILAAAVFDAIENYWYYSVLNVGWREPNADLQPEVAMLWAFTWLKWLALTGALVIAVVLFATLLALHRDERRELFRALFLLRIHLALLVVFALLLLVHEQVPDVLRRWGMDLADLISSFKRPSGDLIDPSARPLTAQDRALAELRNAIFGVLLTLFFGCSIAVTAARLVERAKRSTERSPEPLPNIRGRRLLILLIGPAGITLCVYALARWWDRVVVAIAPLAVLAVYLLLYTLRRDPEWQQNGVPARKARTKPPASRRRARALWLRLERTTPVALILSVFPTVLLFFLLPLPGGAKMGGVETLLLPTGIVLFIAILGRLGGEPPATPRLPLGWGLKLLPGVLGAVPAGVLGLALLRSFVAETVYVERDSFAQGGSDGFAILFGVLLLTATPWMAGSLSWPLAPSKEQPAENRLAEHGQGQPEPDAPVRGANSWHRVTIMLLVALAALAYFGVVRSVQQVAPAVGTIGLVAAFLAVAGGLGSWLALLVERYEAPAAFRLFSLSRVPVILLILIWFAVASILDKGEGGFHRIQTLAAAATAKADSSSSPPASSEQITLQTAFVRWRTANCLPEPSTGQPTSRSDVDPPPQPRTGVPLVFVAASGGGIRAAYWTSLVLNQTLGRPAGTCSPASSGASENQATNTTPLFAASAVSGSSLGLVTYAADQFNASSGALDAWPTNRLGGDYLAANIAWALFVEIPRALVRFTGVRDRGRVLEEAWEQSWSGDAMPGLQQGLIALYRSSLHQPLLLLNGTSVETGCRFLASPLERDTGQAGVVPSDCLALQPPRSSSQARPDRPAKDFPGVIMLTDLLCDDQDVRLSTAVLLSARFPFVSPSGRVDGCPRAGEKGEDRPRTYVVDGGYFDNSASWTLMDVWEATQPLIDNYNRLSTTHCVVPFVLQLDNGYDNPRAPDPSPRPHELQVPLRGVAAARDSQSVSARQQAESVFARPFRLSNAQQATLDGEAIERRYSRFTPQAHPGSQAPLGWALSERTMNDLRNQLTQFNAQGLQDVKRWLTGDLKCA